MEYLRRGDGACRRHRLEAPVLEEAARQERCRGVCARELLQVQ